ncbi:iron-containing alcohol dehydrogenase [Paenibacillus sp. CAU 1782]
MKIFDILTLSATGSEMNSSAVITNEDNTEKFGFNSPAVFPAVSVINPELQATVGNEYLAYSAVDILSHFLDLYLQQPTFLLGLAVVYPAWMNRHMPTNRTRYEQFTRNVFGLNDAESGIEALTDWFVQIGAPIKLIQVEIGSDKIEEIADHKGIEGRH